MGSGAGAAEEAVETMAAAGEKVGVAIVRLFQPFPTAALMAVLPKTTKQIATLDRTKEPGAVGEPLYQAVLAALTEAQDTRRAAVRGGSAGHRRPLRTVLQGVHAVDGQADLRRAARSQVEAPLHRRHLRRRDPPLAADQRHVPPPAPGGRGPGPVLRPRLGRDGRRQQVERQDHRRGHGPVRPGLLRVRLEEVRLGHVVAPAVRAAAHPLHLPRGPGGLRGLPPVRPPRERPDAGSRQARRDLPAQQPVRTGRGLGSPPGPRPGSSWSRRRSSSG